MENANKLAAPVGINSLKKTFHSSILFNICLKELREKTYSCLKSTSWTEMDLQNSFLREEHIYI